MLGFEVGSLADWVSGVGTIAAVVLALWPKIYRPKKEAVFGSRKDSVQDGKLILQSDEYVFVTNVWNRIEHLEPHEIFVDGRKTLEGYLDTLKEIIVIPNGEPVSTGIVLNELNKERNSLYLSGTIKVMYIDTANHNKEIGFALDFGERTNPIIRTVYK